MIINLRGCARNVMRGEFFRMRLVGAGSTAERASFQNGSYLLAGLQQIAGCFWVTASEEVSSDAIIIIIIIVNDVVGATRVSSAQPQQPMAWLKHSGCKRVRRTAK